MTDVDAVARKLARGINAKWCNNDEDLDEFTERDAPTIAAALRDRDTELKGQQFDLLAEVERLRVEVAAMRHDLETSQGLYACDNAEGQSLFVLDHPSIHYCNQESKSSTTT